MVRTDLDTMLPKIRFKYTGLPYLFATYKIHKNNYQWISSFAKCIFSTLASIITQVLKLILQELKTWGDDQAKMILNLHRKKTTYFGVIESLYKFIMNLPAQIRAIYIADITQCYERIPLVGKDNLHEALKFIIQRGFCQHNGSSCEHSIWVHINIDNDLADCAKWDKKLSCSTCWIEMSYERIMSIQSWLINNCYVRLGDAVQRQKIGLPVGFSCSPCGTILFYGL